MRKAKKSNSDPFIALLNFQENIQRSKEKQAKYHNRNARFLQELNRGGTVWIAPQQGSKEWEKGVVKNKHSERSYEVQKENGYKAKSEKFAKDERTIQSV